MSPEVPALPPVYKKIVGDAPTDDRCFWLGEVGFFALANADDDDDIWDQLARHRWLGMHPDLIPFARDGWGNRFCFWRPSDPSQGGSGTILYWMYETFVAVPIASTFDAFLRWVGLATWAHAIDPNYDSVETSDFDDYAEKVAPLLTLPHFPSLLNARSGDRAAVLEAGLQLDPKSPGLLVHRAAMRHAHHELAALDDCRDALAQFRAFTGAHVMMAQILRKERDSGARLEALRASLESPLAFVGDPAMPWFRGIPAIDCDRVAEALSTHPRLHDFCDGEPILALVQHMDPSAPMSWVEIALDHVEREDLNAAIIMGCNALHCAIDDPSAREQVEPLLVQLYEAAEAPWHAALVPLGR